MLLLFHPLIMNPVLFVLLKLQLVCLRVCLFCARKAVTCRRHMPREQLGEREHKILIILLWGMWQSLPRKEWKRKHSATKSQTYSLLWCRLIERILDNEIWRVKGPLFSAHSGMPTWDGEWRDNPSQWRALLFTAVSQDQPDSLASVQETWIIFLVKRKWVRG